MTKISIKFYGTCGSFPVTADDRRVFGGNTSCILFSFGKTKIMLDAGSGANAAMRELGGEKHLDLLISHPHLDHTSGIVSLIPSFGGRELDIYGKTRDGMTVSDICFRLMGKPFWPVSPDLFPGIRFFDVPESFEIGGVKIGTLESNHPGGSNRITPAARQLSAFPTAGKRSSPRSISTTRTATAKNSPNSQRDAIF